MRVHQDTKGRKENVCPHCGRYNRNPKHSYEDGMLTDVYSCNYCGERIRSSHNG